MSTSLQYRSSEILFGPILEGQLNTFLQDNYADSKKIIITDENVFDLWMEAIISSVDALSEAEIIQLPAGEENKNLDICYQVWSSLSDYEIDRNDLIINIGGGVICDMGGFIASTFKRGMDFINIPTTLLSQVDASVGGKTGIDLGPFKNQIGVFADAVKVFVDQNFLSTLDQEQLYSGFAEMLKHGLIADKNHWNQLLETTPEKPEDLTDLIHQSVSIKAEIVKQDFKESGSRKSLNFGHTIGHAIEGWFLENGQAIPHGYGVAWGMLAEGFLSTKVAGLGAKDFEQIQTFIQKHYPQLQLAEEATARLLDLIKNDKKNRQGQSRFTLISSIGNYVIDQEISEELIRESLAFILHRGE
ncbi:MAG: 3-dehydroquinate synthase [Flavobacteriales bacterium]|nr:3-dehydroquinate synthase [Flavobacteriales bacterium]